MNIYSDKTQVISDTMEIISINFVHTNEVSHDFNCLAN